MTLYTDTKILIDKPVGFVHWFEVPLPLEHREVVQKYIKANDTKLGSKSVLKSFNAFSCADNEPYYLVRAEVTKQATRKPKKRGRKLGGKNKSKHAPVIHVPAKYLTYLSETCVIDCLVKSWPLKKLRTMNLTYPQFIVWCTDRYFFLSETKYNDVKYLMEKEK